MALYKYTHGWVGLETCAVSVKHNNILRSFHIKMLMV